MNELLINKLDSALREAYFAFKETSETIENAGLSATLYFTGDIDAIIPLGFALESVLGDLAFGIVHFQHIDQLVESDQVIRISAGSMPKPNLDTAVEDIKARAEDPVSETGVPMNGLWHVPEAGGKLTSAANATGKDVIIAVIDTGIDFSHPVFMSQLDPNKTRILRIWDQGLIPEQLTDAPDPNLLISNNSYGVEYHDTDINVAINGGTFIKHKDCDGHGTHVASIAAGGPLFPKEHNGNTNFMGVAPEASIIAVKLLNNLAKIYYRTNTGQGAEVGKNRKLYDAVVYCLRMARQLDKPVVINMSFGDSSQPGDALDERARILDALVDPTSSVEDELHFPKGAILVATVGNDGNAGADRIIGKVKIPLSGQIDVPFRLKDSRGNIQTAWKFCAHNLHTPDLKVHFWYRRTVAPLAVRFAMRLLHDTTFGADVSIGGQLELGFKIKTGPPPLILITPTKSPEVHRASIEHEDPGAVPHPSGGTVHRHHCQFIIKPKVRGGTVSYCDGVYWVRVKAPPETIIFVTGDSVMFSESSEKGGSIRLVLADPDKDPGVPAFNPDNITPIRDSSIVDCFGQHVITVGAYNDLALPFRHAITNFSSIGPLRDYSDPPGSLPVIPKPDITAPGFLIKAADSTHSENLLCLKTPAIKAGVRFKNKSGTSMSAPMVAGVIACMLNKNSNLNINEVRMHLGARPGEVPAPGDPRYPHAFGKGMIDATVSFNNTP